LSSLPPADTGFPGPRKEATSIVYEIAYKFPVRVPSEPNC